MNPDRARRSVPVVQVEQAAARHVRPGAGEYVLDDSGLMPECVAPGELRERVIAALRTVRDPELPVNVYDLGLVYSLDVDANGCVCVEMTLTAPACPVAGEVVSEVHQNLRALPGVARVRTALVWEPAWTMERLSPAARLALGLL